MNVQQCPKCAYVRSVRDTAPAWQCPACGIAYHKYAAYLNKVKSIATPRSAETDREPALLDGSVLSLVATNIAVLILAIILEWRLVDMMVVYGAQSLVIGASYVARILALDQFSTDNFKINGQSVDPTPQTKRRVAVFFMFHYGFFHFIYFAFIGFGEPDEMPEFGLDLFVCVLAFIANHAFSYRYHRDRDRVGTPNIGQLMFTPYLRVLPMHIIIMVGSFLPLAFGVFLFGMLKSAADVVMHQVEHRLIATAVTAEIRI